MTLTHKHVVNTYIASELNLRLYEQGADFTLRNSLFGSVKLTKNANPDKYCYSGYSIGFDARGSFSLAGGGGFAKNAIIFGADISSSVHSDIVDASRGEKFGISSA